MGYRPTGAATKTAPTSWDNPDLAVYYTLQAPSVTRTATRTLPSSTSTPSGGSSKSRVGAIAGGVVGGLAVLIIILCLILCCLHRKKKSKKEEEVQTVDLPPPVELGVTTAPQELPAHGIGKYMPVHQQGSILHTRELRLCTLLTPPMRNSRQCLVHRRTSLPTARHTITTIHSWHTRRTHMPGLHPGRQHKFRQWIRDILTKGNTRQ